MCVFMLVVDVFLAESVVFRPQWMHLISRSSSRCRLRLGRHCLPGRKLIRNWFQSHWFSDLMRHLLCGLYGRVASVKHLEAPGGTDSEGGSSGPINSKRPGGEPSQCFFLICSPISSIVTSTIYEVVSTNGMILSFYRVNMWILYYAFALVDGRTEPSPASFACTWCWAVYYDEQSLYIFCLPWDQVCLNFMGRSLM